MSRTFEQIQDLVARGEIRISEHGYDELAMDDIFVDAIFAGVTGGLVIEDYPNYHKGPCVLVLQRDQHQRPIHVVWGIPKEASTPAVLVTAYRPDPASWSDDFLRRKE
ncbi:MAG TPA: DUF4258 domain-containing protein [Candidatus Binatia bacterium]|jgi:hypothetical protein|nr:DUF4258 domain-containing protein [Candidatus Binatia bacterium]